MKKLSKEKKLWKQLESLMNDDSELDYSVLSCYPIIQSNSYVDFSEIKDDAQEFRMIELWL